MRILPIFSDYILVRKIQSGSRWWRCWTARINSAAELQMSDVYSQSILHSFTKNKLCCELQRFSANSSYILWWRCSYQVGCRAADARVPPAQTELRIYSRESCGATDDLENYLCQQISDLGVEEDLCLWTSSTEGGGDRRRKDTCELVVAKTVDT